MDKPADGKLAIGIDLGGTHIKGVVIDAKGMILTRKNRTTQDNDHPENRNGERWKTAVRDLVRELTEWSPQQVAAVGLSAPGLPDKRNECISHMPGRLHGLEDFNWPGYLEFANIPVTVLNDAHAALMAESRFGAGKGFANIVMLTLGTGVGGGILIDGRLCQGHLGRAGHAGHMTLNSSGKPGITGSPGTLEDAIGNASLPDRSYGRYHSTAELTQAVKLGDPFATTVWLESVKNLAAGLSSLINIVSPELIILGGGITKAGDLLFDPLHRFLDIYEWRPGGVQTPIRKARFDEYAGAIGAASYAIHHNP